MTRKRGTVSEDVNIGCLGLILVGGFVALVYILGQPPPPPRTYPTSSASFEEVHKAVGCGADGTEAQKEAIFAQNYKDHWMTWEGTIYDVRDRIEVKVDALTSNFDVYPARSQSVDTLNPGSRVRVKFLLREAEGCFQPFYGDQATVETLQTASEIAAGKKQQEDAQLADTIRACGITRDAVRQVDSSVEGIEAATSSLANFSDRLAMEEAERKLKEAKFSGDPTRIAEAQARFDEIQASAAASSRDKKCKSALIEAHTRAMNGDWSLVPDYVAPVFDRSETSPGNSESTTIIAPDLPSTIKSKPPEASTIARKAPLSPELSQTFRDIVIRSGRSCAMITDHVWVNPTHVSLMCDRKLRFAFIEEPQGWRFARTGE